MVLGILESSNNDLNGFFVRFEKIKFLVKCEPDFDHRSKTKEQLALKNFPRNSYRIVNDAGVNGGQRQ